MRCSWVEKNGSRNKIDWERTKNDVSGVVSLSGGDLVHTSTSGGRSGFGGVDLLGWLATTIVVASGTGWSILVLDLVLGTLTRIVACLTTLVTGSKNSAWSWVVWWSWVDEAPHRMASVGCSGGTYCLGSRSCASESLNWMNHRL